VTLRYDSAPARREFILEAVRTAGFVSVSDLARELRVSDMTVRRDLRKLAADGEVEIVHGGVRLAAAERTTGFTRRVATNPAAKRHIGQRAADLVNPGDAIAVDAGTTAYELAAALPRGFGGCIVTHSIPVTQLMLHRPGVRTVGLGGDLYPASQAFVGPMTVEGARNLRVRTFFMGAAAVDARGVYVDTDIERPTKRALMDIADEVVLLVDETKFSTSAPVLLCSFDSVNALVTDMAPPEDVVEALDKAGTVLHRSDGR
jgi:DeoR/GlpR family transcriptional regulator of sugar metabolism